MSKSLFLLINLFISNSILGQEDIYLGTGHPAIDKNFNLIVHTPVDSSTRSPNFTKNGIQKILDETSTYFEPIGVTLNNCEQNVVSNYSFNFLRDSLRIREMKVLFGKPHRINIYLVDDIPFAYCGSSTFEGALTFNEAHIFLERNCVDGLALQLAHHLGHLFGLRDTYHNNDELVDYSNCDTAGDGICDTPADPLTRFNYNEDQYNEQELLLIALELSNDDCEYIGEYKDAQQQSYSPDMSNIMSAYPCKCKFTDNQLRRMVEVYNQSLIKQF